MLYAAAVHGPPAAMRVFACCLLWTCRAQQLVIGSYSRRGEKDLVLQPGVGSVVCGSGPRAPRCDALTALDAASDCG